MAATHTEPQVYPTGADAQTVFTALGAGGYLFDLIEVCAGHFIFHMSFDIFHSPFDGDISQFPQRGLHLAMANENCQMKNGK